MKDEDKQRSDRVIKVFNDTGLNQRQFSELIGVSQQLISAVVNYTKKPNETILLAIIDNIEGIDPLWLFKGNAKYKNNYVPLKVQSPIEQHIKNIVMKQFQELSKDIVQKLSNIEDSVKNSN
ncbi:helix-turn-helix transcriptional regulator [Polaribacter vadi]|uniref:helix-turn-helix domain-containing protein n=1 Tax=Polaribacter TaxID=52959 RepID=UPI001C0A2FC7|nr:MULTISPECIES: helix-turn-helix transcriptional regulator [Polaribacter]MBU3012434.1 helix-turn-helix transcriptional regulator [Polaribacter vadi]MDO6742251.1 helix-turn-helix transcriptional regulator [Polaribacter sp. 1_MG-2023]